MDNKKYVRKAECWKEVEDKVVVTQSYWKPEISDKYKREDI